MTRKQYASGIVYEVEGSGPWKVLRTSPTSGHALVIAEYMNEVNAHTVAGVLNLAQPDEV